MEKRLIFDARAISSKKCGVREVAFNLIKNFDNYEQYEIVIFSNQKIDLELPNSKFILLPSIFSRFNVLLDFFIPLYVSFHKTDTLVSFHSWLPFLLPKRIKMFFILHDTFSFTDKKFFEGKGMARRIASSFFFYYTTLLSVKRAKAVFCPSAYAVREASLVFESNKNKFVKFSNGIAEQYLNRNIHGKERKDFFLYVGNFRSYKGFDILAAAWDRIVNASPESVEWVLVVVGNDKRDRFNSFFSNSTPKQAVFLGQVDDVTLLELYDTCGALVVPSVNEGFGLPLLEGLARNCNVISSDCEAFKEFDQFKKIKYFKSGLLEDLATTLGNFLLSPRHVQNCENNNAQLLAAYTWNSTAKSFWVTLSSKINEK